MRESRLARLQAARLYVITPDAPPARILELAAAVVRGGADVIQLRQKQLPRGELLRLAKNLRAIVDGGLFVVNDDLDIALLSGADGVHLGPDDLSVEAARRVAGPQFVIGASASTAEEAEAATRAGADYVGCGAVFATPVKQDKTVIGPGGVAAVARALGERTPVFAIGGIDLTNLPLVVAAGVRRVCVIRAVGEAGDPEGAARSLRAMLS